MLDVDTTTRLMWFVLFVAVAVAAGVSLLSRGGSGARARPDVQSRPRMPRALAYALFIIGCLLRGFGRRFFGS